MFILVTYLLQVVIVMQYGMFSYNGERCSTSISSIQAEPSYNVCVRTYATLRRKTTT